jgi:endonuclease/exonuclease/phosphatase (EEP) superfamily protein YafD
MAEPFRLMTANLLNGRADPAHLAEILDRVKPDLFVAQELGPDASEVVAQRYRHHRLDPRLDHRGIGIASRFGAEFGRLDLPWRSGAWARIDIGSRQLVLATLHLINPIEFPWWVSVRRRAHQLDSLTAWVDDTVGEGPFVLAGDMNASRLWPAYRRLEQRWDDLAAAAARLSETRPGATWGWRPGWPLILRIDHVFGVGVAGVATTLERVRGSDHAGLVVDLEMEPARTAS